MIVVLQNFFPVLGTVLGIAALVAVNVVVIKRVA